MDYLNRGQSHLPDAIWREIDNAAVEAARERLTGRRYLELQGPFGAGLTSIEVGNDDYCRQSSPEEAGAVIGRAISAPMLAGVSSQRTADCRVSAKWSTARPDAGAGRRGGSRRPRGGVHLPRSTGFPASPAS